jgi:hypothetical protein
MFVQLRSRFVRSRVVHALVVPSLVGAALVSASAWAAEPAMSDEAREKARAGVALLEDPEGARYDEALLAFREAYKLSSNPNLLANIALCALKLERDGEAIEAYTDYLAKGTGILPAERAQVNNDIRTRKATLATLVLEFEPASVQIVDERTNPVDGKVIRNRYDAQGGKLTLGLRSGPHRLIVSAPGYVDKTLNLTLGASSSTTEKVALTPESAKPAAAQQEPPKPKVVEPEAPKPEPKKSAPPVEASPRDGESVPTSVWIGAGVTAALGLGAGVTGALALANKSSFDDANDGTNAAEAEDLRAGGVALNLTTDVLLGATAASAIVTAVLYFTSSDGDEAPASTTLARLRVVPATDARSFAGVALSGAF